MNATTNSAQQLTLSIEGMSCGHCVQTVTKALAALPSVKVRSVAVGSAEIEATPDAANDALVALEGAGYQAKVESRVAATVNSARAGGCCGGPKGCCG
jgi:copper chaperone CopZ